MTEKPTTEMKLEAALESLKAFIGILRVERSDSGLDYGKLRLFYADLDGIDRWVLTEETDDTRRFLEALGEALDNARMVTGELHFP